MTTLYVVAAEDGHCAVDVSEDLARDLADLRRRTSVRLRLVYGAAAPASTAHEVARRVRQALPRKAVCGSWYDMPEAEIVAAVERAIAEGRRRLVPIDVAAYRESATVISLRCV